MKTLFSLLSGIWVLLGCLACSPDWKIGELASPDGQLRFVAGMQKADGNRQLRYEIFYKDSLVMQSSRLGVLMDGVSYGTDMQVENVTIRPVREAYRLKSGKRLETVSDCREMTLTFNNKKGNTFLLIVRAYNDGMAFRYGFPEKSDTVHVMDQEYTEFAVPVGGKAWIHPYDWNSRHKPSYEQYSKNGIAIRSEASHGRGWAFPMLFHTDGVWMMVTEACLDGSYPATHVDNSGADSAYKIRFPESDEPIIPGASEPRSMLPWFSPWRVIVVGDGLNTIFENQLVTHLNPPSVVGDEAWIRPGRACWSWWYKGSSPRSYRDQIKYVDLSHEMGWEYMLIDAGWPGMADGGTMEDVVKYAGEKGVGVWLWYHSGAGRGEELPEEQRLMSDSVLRRAEMGRISRIGVKGIKVDFFDTDKQGIIKLYPAILKDAADHHLMVDLHGATLPRGFERTYPNLLTTEAIRGAETLGRQERCDQAAKHNATIPFTRNVVGSMDYTPVTFSDKIRQGVPAHRRTSVAHQLALAVVFESGFQCYADRAGAYLSLPDLPKQFLKDVPSAWDESRLLAGYPSDFAVVARRKGDNWFIGGISGKNEQRELTFTLPEDCAGKGFTLICDGTDQDSFDYRDIQPKAGKVTVSLLPNGGFAAALMAAK